MFKSTFAPALASASIAIALFSVPLFADEPAGTEQKQEEVKKVEPVDFRKLKEILPEAVGGVKRSNADGSKSGFGDMKISQASGQYASETEEENAPSANISIIDYGAMPGAEGIYGGWENSEIDNESDDEYMRTVSIGDYKGLEQYNTKNKEGSLQLFVGKRFLVQIQITNLDSDVLQKTATDMKLKELEALAK